mmetsp:Transcript_20814/g.40469  ORF Transcript_20814/g.40469 Transcript_20814/m.40469 type:complete len:293 (-) Transcript_20814:4-882(-)
MMLSLVHRHALLAHRARHIPFGALVCIMLHPLHKLHLQPALSTRDHARSTLPLTMVRHLAVLHHVLALCTRLLAVRALACLMLEGMAVCKKLSAPQRAVDLPFWARLCLVFDQVRLFYHARTLLTLDLDDGTPIRRVCLHVLAHYHHPALARNLALPTVLITVRLKPPCLHSVPARLTRHVPHRTLSLVLRHALLLRKKTAAKLAHSSHPALLFLLFGVRNLPKPRCPVQTRRHHTSRRQMHVHLEDSIRVANHLAQHLALQLVPENDRVLVRLEEAVALRRHHGTVPEETD